MYKITLKEYKERLNLNEKFKDTIWYNIFNAQAKELYLGQSNNANWYCFFQQLFYNKVLKKKKYFEIPMFIYYFKIKGIKYEILAFTGKFILIKNVIPQIGQISYTRYGIKQFTEQLKIKTEKTANTVIYQFN